MQRQASVVPGVPQVSSFARLADGADEVHMQTIARNVIESYKKDGSTRGATGDLLL